MEYKYIDTHCHIHDNSFDGDRENILLSMRENNMAAICIGTGIFESEKAVILADQEENIWAIVGLHPADNVLEVFDYQMYKNLCEHKKVVAIGECGLDYFYIDKFFERDKVEKGITHSVIEEKERQKNIFIQNIDLAIEMNLPLMLHIRDVKDCEDAYDDAIEILKLKIIEAENQNKNLSGNVHFFAAGVDIAQKFLDLGFTMSFTGAITFTHDYDEVIKFLPVESIHAETDSPYVSPVPMRGKVNNPNNLIYIVQKLAELKGKTLEEMQEILTQNAKRLYKI